LVVQRRQQIDREHANVAAALRAPGFLLMSLAGLRLGEALGLRWGSVDLESKKLDIHEQMTSDSTKSGEARTVDMATSLVVLLCGLQALRREQSFGEAKPMSRYVVFPWLSEHPDAKEEQTAAKRVRRAMERVLKLAGLPGQFTPHSLRHTFCSLLISSGVSPVYVQQQAGHASVEMTVGVYGSWFPKVVPGAMDRLAAGLPELPVAGPKRHLWNPLLRQGLTPGETSTVLFLAVRMMAPTKPTQTA
jgi:integrase